MTLIHMRYSSPAKDGSRLPVRGAIRWTPTARRVVTGSPDEVVVPIGFQTRLVDGAADVEVDATDPSWVWRVDERIMGVSSRAIFVTVPNTEEMDFTDLPRVDPTTLTPEVEPEAAWWAALEAGLQSATPGPEGPAGHNPITVSHDAPPDAVEGDIWFYTP